MASYRNALPQLDSLRSFLTDGGLETTMIFHRAIDLPEFAAFVLLDRADGEQLLEAYYAEFIRLALDRAAGLILDTPTWRANADWGMRLGYGADQLIDINCRAVNLFASPARTV